MAVSVFDLFTIGIGPSSSHTVGPMRAARQFVHALQAAGDLARITRVEVHLYGSLAATGRGHGTHKALMLGLEGETAEETDVDRLPARIAAITADRRLNLLGQHPIHFDPDQDLVFERRERLPGHPNGMRFVAFADHAVVEERVYYSVGGGFVATAGDDGQPVLAERETPLPLPFSTGRELLALCGHHKLAISDVMLRNECAWRPEADVRAGLLRIWEAMQTCVRRGCEREGQLPGLKLERRAAALHRQLSRQPDAIQHDPLTVIDWVNLFALAVNEENAMGGRGGAYRGARRFASPGGERGGDRHGAQPRPHVRSGWRLVQIPCIERNAMASVEAINASRLALRGTGRHFVSLDKVIRTMRDTGRDMQAKYKETSRGGLATVVSVPVSFIEWSRPSSSDGGFHVPRATLSVAATNRA